VLTGAIKAAGGEEFFAVITVQNGAAPAVTVEGEGLAAKVTVGGQIIRLDGDKIVLEK
jgi:thiamine monophosphate kinase